MTAPTAPYRPVSRAVLLLSVASLIWGCDQRFGATGGLINPPAFTTPTGTFTLRSVDDSLLPHVTTGFGTTYSLVSGSLDISPDSTWAFHDFTVVTAPDGSALGSSPANYSGRWMVTDSVIELVQPSSGTITIRKDTLYWVGGPKFSWEDTLRFAFTK